MGFQARWTLVGTPGQAPPPSPYETPTGGVSFHWILPSSGEYIWPIGFPQVYGPLPNPGPPVPQPPVLIVPKSGILRFANAPGGYLPDPPGPPVDLNTVEVQYMVPSDHLSLSGVIKFRPRNMRTSTILIPCKVR